MPPSLPRRAVESPGFRQSGHRCEPLMDTIAQKNPRVLLGRISPEKLTPKKFRRACELLNSRCMMKKSETKNTLWCSVAVFFILAGSGVAAENAPITPEQFLLLQRQNDQLQQQLRKQQEMID